MSLEPCPSPGRKRHCAAFPWVKAMLEHEKMNPDEISQVAEIDRLNMSKFFGKMGREFEVERRKSKIESDISKGAKFFLVKEKGKVIGYAEYIERENNSVTIKSVQVLPEKMNGFTFLKLIKGIYPVRPRTFR